MAVTRAAWRCAPTTARSSSSTAARARGPSASISSRAAPPCPRCTSSSPTPIGTTSRGFPSSCLRTSPGTRLSVYGARGLDRTLEGSLSGQMQHTYFPVQLDELRADIAFEEVAEERFRVGPFRVTLAAHQPHDGDRRATVWRRAPQHRVRHRPRAVLVGASGARAQRIASFTRARSVTSSSSPASTC